MNKHRHDILSLPVIVGALGFFVDVYDLLLFNIIRKPSLQSLGLPENDILISMAVAFVAAWFTNESFGKDMNFLEQ